MLSDKLKALRLSKKLTQKQIADYLGINQTSYGDYEHGFYEPSITNLKKLARFYRVSIDYLLDYKVEEETMQGIKDKFKGYDRDQLLDVLDEIMKALIDS